MLQFYPCKELLRIAIGYSNVRKRGRQETWVDRRPLGGKGLPAPSAQLLPQPIVQHSLIKQTVITWCSNGELQTTYKWKTKYD